jgi:hypothetical protein
MWDSWKLIVTWLARMQCFCIMQFINVYTPKYETAGRFWPIVHDSMIFALVLMQLIAVGSFALKKLSPASTWTLPLPVLTLLFNHYCRRRFLPIFTAYSAEVKFPVTMIVFKYILQKLNNYLHKNIKFLHSAATIKFLSTNLTRASVFRV